MIILFPILAWIHLYFILDDLGFTFLFFSMVIYRVADPEGQTVDKGHRDDEKKKCG